MYSDLRYFQLNIGFTKIQLSHKSKTICIQLMISIERILYKFIRLQHDLFESKIKKYRQK